MQTFVSLDIETTGFNPEKDQIIEFAAVKFTENEVTDTYQSLINPEQPVPPLISHMTGISDDLLKDSPTLDKVSEEIIRFIGSSPIVGHNIEFDVTFLNQKGLPLKNDLYDTLQLSSILLPGLPSYSLDTLGRILKIEHLEKHRALSDSVAAYNLFKILLEKIKEIDDSTLKEINIILDKSSWSLKKLFKPKNFAQDKHQQQSATGHENNDFEPHAQRLKPLTDDQFNSFFNSDGPLSKVIQDYESRPSQTQITEKITKAFREGNHCMIEAGTGTGKTLAYLLSAVHHTMNGGSKVVISTYTKNLQDQIFNKDIPLLKEALMQIDKNLSFRHTLLKGRRNYISLKRLNAFMDKPLFEDHEATFLLKIMLWLKQTENGDLEEVNLQGREYPLKDDVCCDEYTDEEEDFFQRNFLKEARRKAEMSDIIVVNHALTVQDSVSESGLLPEYDYIIFDEAHHLESVTTESLTINLSLNSFVKPYEKLIRIFAGLEKSNLVLNVATKTEQILTRTEIFFGLLGIFIEKYSAPDAYQSQLIIKESALSSLEWNKVKDSAEILNDLNTQLLSELQILTGSLAKEENNTIGSFAANKSAKNAPREIRGISHEIQKRTENMHTVFLSGDWQNRINWTYKTFEGLGCIKSAPLLVGETLKNIFYDAKKSVILTSATLRTDNSFDYLRKSLNLDERFEEAALPSHFSYPDQVKIIIPEDLPRPMTEGYFKACSQIIRDIIFKNGGRTLVLFTSKKALIATYMDIAPGLRKEGYEVLAQGLSGGKGKILEHFKQEPGKSALFGTDSFWEGVDIAGDMLTCIVMQKLPFDPPTDPIISARGALYSDSFGLYQLPRAILKFKQGFGRLIRTEKDKGSMVILDSRIIQNGYGHRFLESLPEGIRIDYGTTENIPELL